MRNFIAASLLMVITSVAQADSPEQLPDDGTVEHFEYRVETTRSTRTITDESPTRAVVETSSSWTSDEEWSQASYFEDRWIGDAGSRSDQVHDQRTTVRKRPVRPRPSVTRSRAQRSPTIGSPCSSSRIRCCPE